MRIAETPKYMTVTYDNLADMMGVEVHPENAERSETLPTNADNLYPKGITWYGLSGEDFNERAPFTNVASCGSIYQAVTDYVIGGWPKGREVMAGLKAGLPPVNGVTSIKKRRVRGDSGDELLLAELYSGHLDTAWATTRRDKLTPGGTSCITIHVIYGDNCKVTAQELMYNGLAAIVLADELTAAGYQVEIIATVIIDGLYPAKKGSKISVWHTPVKSFGENLDCDRLAAVIGLAGFFRAQGFKAFMSLPYQVISSFGHSAGHKAREILGPDVIIVKSLYDKDKAVEFLNYKIDRINNGQECAA